MWISLIVDGVITALLGVTIFYCVVVNRRLAALRSGKDELRQVIEDLTVATTSAQMGVERLKEAGRDVIGTLEDDVRKGRALSDELSLMIEAGNNLADRLEGGRQRTSDVEEKRGTSVDDDTRRLVDSADGPEARVDAGSQVRARVQVQSDVNRLKSTKAGAADAVIENELLKALRRAR